MHILFLIGSLDVGGAEAHLVDLAIGLKQYGWQITVVTHYPASTGVLEKKLAQAGIAHKVLMPARCVADSLWTRLCCFFYSWKRLHQYLKTQEGILSCFLPEAFVLGVFGKITARFKGPLIMNRRSLSCYQKRRPFFSAVERRLYPFVTQATGNSAAVTQELISEGFRHPKLLYNGINAAHFFTPEKRLETRQSLEMNAETVVLIQIAHLHAYKGYESLLNAMQVLSNRGYDNVMLLCVGQQVSREYATFLTALTQKLGLEKKVFWVGFSAHIASLLAASDIGVLCSDEEGFSNAVLQKMAAGLPVIARDVGGNAEAISHDVTGYVFQNQRGLIARLEALIVNAKKRTAMGHAGRKRIEECFSLHQCLRRNDLFYRKHLQK